MAILRILDPPPTDVLTKLDLARARREIEIQELRAACDVDRTGAKRLLLLRWLGERGRLER